MGMIKWILVLCMMAVTLPGCDNSKASEQGTHTAAPFPGSSTPDAKRSEGLTFGIIYPMAHPFYEMITESIEKASKARSIDLIVKAPDQINLEQQMRMMETMIKSKVNGIAIDPIDSAALAPLINKAVQSGIPVICFESDAPASNRYTFIGSDPLKEGALMGQIIDRNLKGKGMILIEGSLSQSPQLKQRLEGILQYLKNNTEIQTLDVRYNDGRNDTAITDLQAMINDHPHFDALISLDVISSSNSILVWKSQGLKRYALTFGMNPEVKEALINGQITSVVSENEETWGEQIIEQLLAARTQTPVSNAWIDTGFQEVKQSDLPDIY